MPTFRFPITNDHSVVVQADGLRAVRRYVAERFPVTKIDGDAVADALKAGHELVDLRAASDTAPSGLPAGTPTAGDLRMTGEQ